MSDIESSVLTALKQLHTSPGEYSVQTCVGTALLAWLEHGLKGNRAVSGSVWSVVTAATRAFPIQLSPSVEKAQAVAEGCAGADLVQTWVIQALADGSLVTLVQRLRSQPQIITAYARDALIRDAKAAERLVAQLQQLQELISVTPYDRYLQQQPAQDAGQQAAPVHIQTEEDLQLPPQQQQQVDAGITQQQQQQQQNDQPPTPGKQGIVGRLSSQRLPLSSFGRSKAIKASSSTYEDSKRRTGASGVESELPQDAECVHQLVKVQLQVVTPVGEAAPAGMAQHQLVQLLLQVQTPGESQPATPSKASAGSSSSSSSKLLGAGADAVKGLLQGLQHSAAAGLHQSAAAGQELTGAVAAAGEAVMGAMITQPFAAVKGFAARAGGSRQGPPAGPRDSSSNAATAQQGGNPEGSSGRRLANLFSKKHSSAAAAAAGTEDTDKQDSAAASAAADTEDVPRGDEQLLHVQLLTSPDSSSSCPVQLVITPIGAAAAGAAPVSRATSTSPPSWHSSKGLLGKFKRGSSKDCVGRQQQGTVSAPVTAAAAETPGAEEVASGADDVLEGDMWSVMTRLKQGGGGKAAKHGAASPTVAAAEAAAAAAQQQQQEGLQLLQQLLDTCAQVQVAAAASKGALGDECEPLLLLVVLIQQALNHGLRNTTQAAAAAAAAARDEDGSAGSKAAAAARDVLGGWLPRQDVTAFGVLQALQHGSKQHPRLMLGADGIARMKAARSSPSSVKLDMWVRASLNEQLIGVRLSSLAANPEALWVWYAAEALLLQQEALQLLLQKLRQLSEYRFALLVDSTAAVGAAVAVGGSGGDSGRGSARESSSSSSSSKAGSGLAGIPDPRKLLGGFSNTVSSLGFGALPGFGGGHGGSTQAAAATGGAGSDAAAPADPAGMNNNNPHGGSIPTFLWSALGGGTATDATAGNSAAAAAAANGAGAAAGGSGGSAGFFSRRRRVPHIQEVRVPPPDSAVVLSTEGSCALSPVSAAGDAAYAEWWSPNGSWEDGLAGAAGGGGSRSSSASGLAALGEVLRSDSGEVGNLAAAAASEQQQRLLRRPGSRGRLGSSSESGMAAAAGVTSPTGAQSEAALKIEQELAAAMTALVGNTLTLRRSGSGSGDRASSGSGSSSVQLGGQQQGLHRSSSAGWEAAVARARSARSPRRDDLWLGLGVMGSVYHPGGSVLHRRSRSPDASGAASQLPGGGGSGRGSRPGHRPKRSSSLNDLPELQALLQAGDMHRRGV